MNDFADFRAEFSELSADVGIRTRIRATSTDSPPVIVEAFARFGSPDSIVNGAQITTEHEIEYATPDIPWLREGHRIDRLDDDGNPIDGQAYRVRGHPYVTDSLVESRDGYWRCALLTAIS